MRLFSSNNPNKPNKQLKQSTKDNVQFTTVKTPKLKTSRPGSRLEGSINPNRFRLGAEQEGDILVLSQKSLDNQKKKKKQGNFLVKSNPEVKDKLSQKPSSGREYEVKQTALVNSAAFETSDASLPVHISVLSNKNNLPIEVLKQHQQAATQVAKFMRKSFYNSLPMECRLLLPENKFSSSELKPEKLKGVQLRKMTLGLLIPKISYGAADGWQVGYINPYRDTLETSLVHYQKTDHSQKPPAIHCFDILACDIILNKSAKILETLTETKEDDRPKILQRFLDSLKEIDLSGLKYSDNKKRGSTMSVQKTNLRIPYANLKQKKDEKGNFEGVEVKTGIMTGAIPMSFEFDINGVEIRADFSIGGQLPKKRYL